VEEAMWRMMIGQSSGGSSSSSSSSKKQAAADALAVRRATLALQKVHEWEKEMFNIVVAAKNKIKRLDGNVLISLRGGGRGLLDICGDAMHLQLPAGMTRRYEDMEWLKSPITNLIHVEKGGGGGRFYFDIVVDQGAIDNDDYGNNDARRLAKRIATTDGTDATTATETKSSLRQTSVSSLHSTTTEGDDVRDAEGRLYDHDDHYLRILSISFRRARTRWVMDRERMLQLLLDDENEKGESIDTMDLWVADMALEGIDAKDERNRRRQLPNIPRNPAYVFQTTWLPYSKLMFTVLDYRMLGPPWRVTQWMTGTMKSMMVDHPSSSTASTLSAKEQEADTAALNAATKPFRTIMNAVQRYVRSPDLSMKCALSVSLDGGDDDDLSFFCEDDEDEEDEEDEEGGGTKRGGVPGEESDNHAKQKNDWSMEEIAEQGDEASAPNIAFSFTNWPEGIRYHPKKRKDDDDEMEATSRPPPPKTGSFLDGTMAEFNMTFSVQDILDDITDYNSAFAVTEVGGGGGSGGVN